MNYKNIFNELYKKLENRNIEFNKNLLMDKLEKTKFSKNVLCYSSGLAYNYTPYFIESIGCEPKKFKKNKPLRKSNYFEYLGDKNIEKINFFGVNGSLADTDFIIENDNIKEIISVDKLNELIQYFRIVIENDKVIESYHFSDEDNSSETVYFYDNKELYVSLSSVILNGLRMNVIKEYKYDKNGELESICSIIDECRGYLFKK